MRKRETAIIVRLSPSEHHRLKEKVVASGLKQEVFMRKLISEKQIRARPQRECVELLSEVRHMSKVINQIARIAQDTRKFASQDIEMLLSEYKNLIAAAKLLI